MKHKYLILKDNEKNKLIIKEFAETDKDISSLLCIEKYNDETVKSAIEKGKDALVSTLRTVNIYPPGVLADKLAETVINLYAEENWDETLEVFFDDSSLLETKAEELSPPEDQEVENDSDIKLDDILDDKDLSEKASA